MSRLHEDTLSAATAVHGQLGRGLRASRHYSQAPGQLNSSADLQRRPCAAHDKAEGQSQLVCGLALVCLPRSPTKGALVCMSGVGCVCCVLWSGGEG